MNKNVAYEKSLIFSILIINLYKCLQIDKEYILSKQLLRSGTGIGANIAESISAHSKKEFCCKLDIALKEARETEYWLQILKESKLTKLDCSDHLQKVEELIRILCSSTKTIKDQLKDIQQ